MLPVNKDKKNTILVAPLHWGLGHATRCIPIIRELLAQNAFVLLAADGMVATLLRKEFPQLTILPLKSFTIQYPQGRKGFFLKILRLFPSAIFCFYREKKWLRKTIKKYAIDAVISDNRMGLYNKSIPCIYITHQLSIKTGLFSRTEKWAQKIHYYFINRFYQCWVPDFEEKEVSLAGDLSHPNVLPKIPVKYINPLSRFENIINKPLQYNYLVLLSGPEPQRSIFEDLLLKQISSVEGSFLLVRGLPEEVSIPQQVKNATIINHLSAETLNEAIIKSDIIISRSGYTTVMDLFKLQKKAILVPTPGQPEQEYLASHLLKHKIFYTTTQEDFVLKDVLNSARNFINNFSINSTNMNSYKTSIADFLLSLNRGNPKN
ncbi:MAG TPA: glycosyltransferase [Chitinophagaceae bacterium]|nr:glycosyltransferase [Chitinophagaceae bacterium]